MSIDASEEKIRSKSIRAIQVLENMSLMPISDRESTFTGDDGQRIPIKYTPSVFPMTVRLSMYINQTYDKEIFEAWHAMAYGEKNIIQQAEMLIEVIDLKVKRDNELKETWVKS